MTTLTDAYQQAQTILNDLIHRYPRLLEMLGEGTAPGDHLLASIERMLLQREREAVREAMAKLAAAP